MRIIAARRVRLQPTGSAQRTVWSGPELRPDRLIQWSMRIGAHMSVAGGVSKAVERAVVHGCEALQIFSKNASQWHGKPLDPAEVRRVPPPHRRDRHHAGRLARQLSDQPRHHVSAAARAVDRRLHRRARSRRDARPARRRHPSGHVHGGTEDDALRLIADAIRARVHGAAAPADDGAARTHGRTGPDARPSLRAPGGDPRASRRLAARRRLPRHLPPRRLGLRHRQRRRLRARRSRRSIASSASTASRCSTATTRRSRAAAASIGTSTSARAVSASSRSAGC